MKKKKLKVFILSLSSLILLLIIGCGVYVSDYYHADETALSMLESGESVTVEFLDDGVAFIPEEPTDGFIFYPGGKVEYTAYATLLHKLAKENILCILLEMPFNLAVFNMNAAEGIPAKYPKIEDWYIGGHSLGGSMAASHAGSNTDVYDGLVLLASYSTADFSESDLQVFSIYGTEDKVLNLEKYSEYFKNLPESTSEFIIDGGCHAYFGSYGAQEGDGTPTITAEEQVRITAEQLILFFGQE